MNVLKTIVFIILMTGCCQSAASEEIIHIASGEWPPYFSKDLDHYGVGSRIVTEAFALEGVTVVYGFFPWIRSLKMAEIGEWDAVVGFEVNREREKQFIASEPVWDAPWVFFYDRASGFDWDTFHDLKGIVIGGTFEYMYTPEFLDAERSGLITVDRVKSDDLNMIKLVHGRIRIFPQLVDVGYNQIHQLLSPAQRSHITHHPKAFGKHMDYLLFSRQVKRNEIMVQVFNRGLEKLKESGAYERLFQEARKDYGDIKH